MTNKCYNGRLYPCQCLEFGYLIRSAWETLYPNICCWVDSDGWMQKTKIQNIDSTILSDIPVHILPPTSVSMGWLPLLALVNHSAMGQELQHPSRPQPQQQLQPQPQPSCPTPAKVTPATLTPSAWLLAMVSTAPVLQLLLRLALTSSTRPAVSLLANCPSEASTSL